MNNQFDRCTDTIHVEHLLTKLFAAAKPSPAFRAGLRNLLAQRAEQLRGEEISFRKVDVLSRGRQTRPRSNVSRRGRWLVYGLCLLILMILVINYQPVLAAVQRLSGYGYVPLAGFIDLSDTRVLAGPTIQVHGARRLIVTQAVASSTEIRIWLRLEKADVEPPWIAKSGQSPNTWLETGDGRRLYPWSQSWSSSGKQSAEAYLEFRAVAAEEPVQVSDVTSLVLKVQPDWTIPLRFNPAANVGSPLVTIYPDACETRSGVRLCVLASAFDEQETHILIGGEAINPKISLFSLVDANPLSGETQGLLRDDHGHTLAPLPLIPAPPIPIELPPGGVQQTTEILHFGPVSRGTTFVTLRIPAVEAQIPVGTRLDVDIGPSPEPGENFNLDIAIEADGQTIRFERAEVIRSPDGVQLVLTSAPVSPRNGRLVTGLNVTVPLVPGDERRTVGTGLETTADGIRLRLWLDLEDDQGQVKGGVQHVMIESAQLALLGPFEISWQRP